MTVQAIRGVGYCARMTRCGDWAFDYSLDLAVSHDVRLDIFFFPTPPSRPHAPRGRSGELAEIPEERKIEMEKDVRLYFDEMLGDYVNVGFRLCEGDEDPELRRCLLVRKEYDVLVLPYEGYRCRFGERPIEEFAESMPCPTVLVGPERPGQYFVNTAAGLWIEKLRLEHEEWSHVNDVVVRPPAADG
jgi:hypothetical protein